MQERSKEDLPVSLSTASNEETMILEPSKHDPEKPLQYKSEVALLGKIQKVLKDMGMGQDITYEEFLNMLDTTEEKYIQALKLSIKTEMVFLKRKPSEIRVNAYNKHLLQAWQANLDIQFVLNVCVCACYVASYVTKSQQGISELLRKASGEARKGNSSIKDQLRVVGNKFLNTVELSAQEAVYILLRLPMKKASRMVIFVNRNPPEERVVLLKPQKDIDAM